VYIGTLHIYEYVLKTHTERFFIMSTFSNGTNNDVSVCY